MAEQTEAIIQNTEAILKASGTGLERVVKVVVRQDLSETCYPLRR